MTAPTQSPVSLRTLLDEMIGKDASDLHISAGDRPKLRVDGDIVSSTVDHVLTPRDTLQLAYSVLTENQKKRFEMEDELDFSFGIANLSRFRGMVIRQIPFAIKTFADLNLAPVIAGMAERPRGLVLVTGPTGSGKSTTLAAMIDKINTERRGHIITVEDPIEFIHKHRNCIINQREVGADTKSFASALKYALREDPDVILIGEMRDLETIELAMTAAATGHLVFGTLHTSSAAKTVDRIIDVFPTNQQNQVRATLSESLKGVVAQNLFKRIDKAGRCAALEILVCDSPISNLVREGKTHQIPGMMQVGKKKGNQPLDDAIMEHLRAARISPEEAYEKSIDKKKFRPLLKEPPNDLED